MPVRCHRVVNKGSRCRPSTCCGSCCSHTLHLVFAHSSRPVLGIRCPCVRTFIAHSFKITDANSIQWTPSPLTPSPFRRLLEIITQKYVGIGMQDMALLCEGKRLYASGLPKAAQMRTDNTSTILTSHLSTSKRRLIIYLQVPATYRLG